MQETQQVFPGIWRVRFGCPNSLTPISILKPQRRKELLSREAFPFPFSDEFQAVPTKNGFFVEIPLEEGEDIYGFGLQMGSFRQNGSRKTLRTNADAEQDTGDAHAPVPFYVSVKGYGVLVDTAKCVEFDCGAARRVGNGQVSSARSQVQVTTEALYQEKTRSKVVTVYIRGAEGIDLYIFAGGNIRGAVEAYNLFSGGGVLPPLWGLGTLYRCCGQADQGRAEELARQLHEEEMPISAFGLEPGWQSHAYSSSLLWDSQRFPDPERLAGTLHHLGMRLNLWEQAYVHPTAAIYEELRNFSGNYEVWEGLVPDFAHPEACRIYGEMQESLVNQGVDAFKLDECDGSDYTGNWFFPDFSEFPSGLSGEEEKNLYGAMVQRVIQEVFTKKNKRTYSQVRASWSHAAPMPFVLYSDLYDHKKFIRALVNASFCGLLWSPEVRDSHSPEELIRRLQTVVCSPLSIINAWAIPSPPWKQYDSEKNWKGEFLPDSLLQDQCRELLNLRCRLIPYLYTAFARYYWEGTPPFRALVLDYPDDLNVREIDTEYMMGDRILVAPILAGEQGRTVYLPEGDWYDFWTGKKYSGGQSFSMEMKEIPLYVRGNTILPLGTGEFTAGEVLLTVRLYGDASEAFVLFHDDGETLDYQQGEQQRYTLSVENGRLTYPEMAGYRIKSIENIP